LSLKKLKTLSTKSLLKNPYWEYRLDNYTLPDGKIGEYHYVHTPGSVMVVPVDGDGRLVLVKQYRYLWQRESIEFPCGGVKKNDFLGTANDELAEEASLAASEFKLVGEYNPFNGASDEVAKIYFAHGLTVAAKAKDASEEFEVVKLTAGEFESMIDRGGIWDGMTLVAWTLARRTVLDYMVTIRK